MRKALVVLAAVGAAPVALSSGVVGYFNPIIVPIFVQHVFERPLMGQMISHFAGVLNSVPA